MLITMLVVSHGLPAGSEGRSASRTPRISLSVSIRRFDGVMGYTGVRVPTDFSSTGLSSACGGWTVPKGVEMFGSSDKECRVRATVGPTTAHRGAVSGPARPVTPSVHSNPHAFELSAHKGSCLSSSAVGVTRAIGSVVDVGPSGPSLLGVGLPTGHPAARSVDSRPVACVCQPPEIERLHGGEHRRNLR